MITSIDRYLCSQGILELPAINRASVKLAKLEWARARREAGASDSSPALLTGTGDDAGQAKFAKGVGARIVGITLAPDTEVQAIAGRLRTFGIDLSSASTCDFSTPQCSALCLKGTGRQAFDYAATARVARTWFLVSNPINFATLLVHELNLAAKKFGPVDFRPDVLSDLSWDKFMPWLGDLDSVHMVYGYTKNIRKARRWQALDGWHATFSASERTNVPKIQDIVGAGINVAIPVDLKKKDDLPSTWGGLPVEDGDANDRRYKDPTGVAVLLRAKSGMGNKEAMNSTPVGVGQFIKPAVV